MIPEIRLACHQLAEPEFERPADLVSWMGAIQAQDYAMSKWAIGIRLKAATVGRIDEALANGEIVRTHILRPTWHYVAGKDLRWILQLTGARVKKAVDSWVRAGGLTIPEIYLISMNRIEKEKEIVGMMIRLYCRKKEGNKSLCRECIALMEYARTRLDHCSFGEGKTSCKHCQVHCYKPEMRERMRKVMRFAGPQMLFYHPWAAIRHLLKK